MQLKHWQTTALGVIVIIAALAHQGVLYLTHQGLDYSTLIGGVGMGLGLVRGADAAKVNEIINQLKGSGKQ